MKKTSRRKFTPEFKAKETSVHEEKSKAVTMEDKIKEIQAAIKKINAIKDWTNTTKREYIMDGKETATYYSKDGSAQKIDVIHPGEAAWSEEEYYLSDNTLILMVETIDNIDNELYGAKQEKLFLL